MKDIKKLLKFKVCFIIILSMVIFPFAMTGCSCSCLILPPFPYNWSEWTVTTDPTCDTYGEEARVCQNDPSRTETRPVPPLTNHIFGEWLSPSERVLIIEREDYSSDKLADILKREFYVSIINIIEAPDDIASLLLYGQIILNNVSNFDMPNGFDVLLDEFVYVHGRGLLTAGGFRYCEYTGDRVVNLYCRQDLSPNNRPSLLQQMLPVEAMDYVHPTPQAFVIVIDRGGSMNRMVERRSRLEYALRAATLFVRLLDPRDYVAIVSFASNVRTDIGLTSVARRSEIESAIDRIQAAEVGAVFSGGLLTATDILERTNIPFIRKQILFISDGLMEDHGVSSLSPMLNRIYNNNIVLSTIAVAPDEVTGIYNLRRMVELVCNRGIATVAGGVYVLWPPPPPVVCTNLIIPLNLPAFYATVAAINYNAKIAYGINAEDIPILGGVFGSRNKLHRTYTASLVGPYGLPLHAQWDFGDGKVASFMSTLNADAWSYEFMSDEIGQQLILNMVRSLMPAEPILWRMCSCGEIEFYRLPIIKS